MPGEAVSVPAELSGEPAEQEEGGRPRTGRVRDRDAADLPERGDSFGSVEHLRERLAEVEGRLTLLGATRFETLVHDALALGPAAPQRAALLPLQPISNISPHSNSTSPVRLKYSTKYKETYVRRAPTMGLENKGVEYGTLMDLNIFNFIPFFARISPFFSKFPVSNSTCSY